MMCREEMQTHELEFRLEKSKIEFAGKGVRVVQHRASRAGITQRSTIAIAPISIAEFYRSRTSVHGHGSRSLQLKAAVVR